MTYEEKLEQKERDMQTLELYEGLDEKLFCSAYKVITERLETWGMYGGLKEVTSKFKSKFESLEDDREVSEKIEQYKAENNITIRR